jgi:hypothetical protein
VCWTASKSFFARVSNFSGAFPGAIIVEEFLTDDFKSIKSV